jgi:diguanylate cyclase (GGDEF)-like protein
LSSSEAAQESRRAICRAARQLSDGEFAHVFELGPGGKTLILTAADGSGIDTLELSLTDRRSLVSDSFLSGQPLFSGDVLADDRVDKEAAGRVGIRAGCFQPIIREGRPIGVLVVGWRTRIEVLSPRVASLLALFATQSAAVLERADLIARLVELARTDALTGLSNRRAFDEFLGLEIDRANRTARPLSVALIDLDHFKQFNDERGHQAGDWLLAETARSWRAALRPTDMLARYGGEEFVAVLPDCEVSAGLRTIERLQRKVPADQTFSAGIAARLPGECAADLLQRADAAMYLAKGAGRNRTVIAQASSPIADVRDPRPV